MQRLILAALLLVWASTSSAQTMTCSSSNFSAVSIDTSTASASKTVVIPTDVPSGATVLVGILNRTDETTTLSSVSDPVNGTWSLTGTVAGPTDAAGTTGRIWSVHRLNSAALSGAGNRTLTVTTSTGVSTQIAAGWCSDSGGALTLDEVSNSIHNDAANDTNHDTSTVTVDAAGGLVSFLASNNAITSLTMDGAGESYITAAGAGIRAGFVFEASAAGGATGFEITSNPTLQMMNTAHAFLSPSGAATCRGGMMLLGAGSCD